MTVRQKTPAEIVANNLDMLMKEKGWVAADLARHSGVAPRTAAYAAKAQRSSRINTLDKMALAFRLRGWELLIPHESVETLKSGVVGEIVHNYLKCGPEGREHVKTVATREAALTDR